MNQTPASLNSSNLIIGSNSGLGSSIARSLLSQGDTVHGSYRTHPTDLPHLQYHLDLSKPQSISKYVNELEAVIRSPINRIFFCSALTQHPLDPPFSAHKQDTDWHQLLSTYFQVNICGVISLIYKILNSGILDSHAKICVFSSLAGSIALRGSLIHNRPGGNLSYRVSKAALNCAVRNIAYDLQASDDRRVIFTIHPGWVKTASGGPNAPLEPEMAAELIIGLTDRITNKQSGLFLDINGIPLQY